MKNKITSLIPIITSFCAWIALGTWIIVFIISTPINNNQEDDSPWSISWGVVFYYNFPTTADPLTRKNLETHDEKMYQNVSNVYNNTCSRSLIDTLLRRCFSITKEVENFSYDSHYVYWFGRQLTWTSIENHIPLWGIVSWDSVTKTIFLWHIGIKDHPFGNWQVNFFKSYGNTFFLSDGDNIFVGHREKKSSTTKNSWKKHVEIPMIMENKEEVIVVTYWSSASSKH